MTPDADFAIRLQFRQLDGGFRRASLTKNAVLWPFWCVGARNVEVVSRLRTRQVRRGDVETLKVFFRRN